MHIFKHTICSLAVLTLLSWSARASAQGSADAALDDAVRAAESAAAQSVLTSAVNAVRVLGMPEQIQAAVLEVSNQLEKDREAESDDSEARDDGVPAYTDDPSVSDDEADSALASFEAARNEDKDEDDLGVDSAGRRGGDAVTDQSADIDRPEPRTPSGSATDSEPEFDLGQRAESSGVARVINENRRDIQACYEQRLAEKPNLSGRVAVKFMVDTDGQLVAPIIENSSLQDDAVESCIIETLRAWSFPEPVSGQRTTWTFPFEFSPGR